MAVIGWLALCLFILAGAVWVYGVTGKPEE